MDRRIMRDKPKLEREHFGCPVLRICECSETPAASFNLTAGERDSAAEPDKNERNKNNDRGNTAKGSDK